MVKSEQFHEIALRRINEFIEQTMLEVPELRGLIVVPVWQLDSEQLPTAVIRGPDGKPNRLSDIFAMSQSVLKVQAVLHQYQLAGLKQFDQRAAALAGTINAANQVADNGQINPPGESRSVTAAAPNG